MSQSHALSDDQVRHAHRSGMMTRHVGRHDDVAHTANLQKKQVAGELRKMTAFIRQEALEKAREIQLKADEEFAIEKSKLVRQETAAIDTLYEKKFKQASMSQQITRSTLANRTRLRVLSSRQELLDNLFQQARDSISGIATKDAKKYQVVLKGLVLEGLYALNESKVTIRARTKDNDAVKEAIGEAEKEFNEVVGKEVSAELDEDEPLPEGSYVSSISSPPPPPPAFPSGRFGF